MIKRKKRLRIIQLILLLFGTLIIFYTYVTRDKISKQQIIPKETQEKLKKQLADETKDGDVFYSIQYSGLDMAGNRYILKSEEAKSSKSNQ